MYWKSSPLAIYSIRNSDTRAAIELLCTPMHTIEFYADLYLVTCYNYICSYYIEFAPNRHMKVVQN